MIDTLLRALDLRTGRFTSPHVERMTERICIDGEPLTDEEFVRAFNDVAPYTHLVDADQPHPLSFFETVVGDGVRRVRRRPGRRRRRRGRHGRHVGRHQRRRRRGRGGAADRRRPRAATSATTRPTIAGREGRDHQARLDRGARRAAARGRPRCCCDRAAEVGATLVREGVEFGVRRAVPGRRRPGGVAAGARGRGTTRCSCRCTAPTRRRTPPSRWPRSRRSSATSRSTPTWCAAAFAEVTSPGRLEIIRRSPTIVLDAAHNPHGAEATAAALEDSFAFTPLIGVIGVMADKDARGRAGGVRAAPGPRRLHPELHRPRACRPSELAVVAREVFGEDRVTVAPRLADAIDQAAALAEAGEAFGGVDRLRRRAGHRLGGHRRRGPARCSEAP